MDDSCFKYIINVYSHYQYGYQVHKRQVSYKSILEIKTLKKHILDYY